MGAEIRAIEYYLPDQVVHNADLAQQFPDWSVDKIEAKTGIVSRHVAGPDECSSDLAVAAAGKLFQSGACTPQEIDFVLLCTQSPDYLLPTTACLIQDRLGIPTTAGAFDFNLGCSGFIYGLGVAKGLIETGQAERVLLLTAETYTKYIHPEDKSIRTIFGDAAAATLVARSDNPPSIGPFVYGTDGRGASHLIVRHGGLRRQHPEYCPGFGPDHLYMNGPAVFEFTMSTVPQSVEMLLRRAQLDLEAVDLYVFHQANQFMLDYLRKKIRIPSERFVLAMRSCGNTVGSTIPIALKDAQAQHRLTPGKLVMLVGFGVGFSWGGTLVRWACE
jgi:3-oxoacyl-[acyl-carrier-protein] synthase-3